MNRKHGASSKIVISDQLTCQVIPLVGRHASCFTSEEDRFFSEGDALSDVPATRDTYDDVAATRTSRHWLTRRRSLMGGAIGTSVVVGIVLLALSRGQASGVASEVTIVRPTPAQLPQPLEEQPATSEPIPQAASPTPTPSPTPTVGADQPSSAPAPTDARVFPSPAQASAGAAADSAGPGSMEACRKAYDQRRYKDLLVKCADAFAADSQSADAALLLAKTEFDRGHTAKAADWAQKAIAIDAEQADAYVFLGGAEQAAGHKDAARAAYRRYLQLSPQGRYAADLRAVLASL